MAERCINIDRDTPMLLPVDLRDWIAEGQVTVLTAKAKQADKSGEPECSVSLPEDIARHNQRR